MNVAVEDGRSYVRRSPKQYDIIQASLVDTWAATAAGAYALSENSLYTVEAFEDYLDHLTDRGVLSVSRWVFDGLRLISLAQEAGARRGWNPADRLAIIQQDKVATFLLKKTPFTPQEVQTLADAADNLGFAVLYLPGRPVQTFGDNRDEYARLLLAPGPPRVLRTSTRSTSRRRRMTGRSFSTRRGCATTRSWRPCCGCSGCTWSARSTRVRGRPAA